MSVGLCGHRKLSVPSLHSCRYFGVSDQRPLPPPPADWRPVAGSFLLPESCFNLRRQRAKDRLTGCGSPWALSTASTGSAQTGVWGTKGRKEGVPSALG